MWGVDCDRVIFSGHAVRRMFERAIRPKDVVALLRSGEIIIHYPEDDPFPSFLILGSVRGRPLHVLAALDDETGTCYIVTTYEPDPDLWEDGFRVRRTP